MAKVLFLTLHRKNRSPGQRYRHEQYLQYLIEIGFNCTFSPLLPDKKSDYLFYNGSTLRKIIIGISALVRRIRDLLRVKEFDIVYIYRDAFFFGTFIEKWLAKSSIKIIYDFDDAIWLMDKNPNQGLFNLLKNPGKTEKIIEFTDLVLVGNTYLESYARRFQSNVKIIPSTIDMASYDKSVEYEQERICIGWTGSFSTLKHFETLITVLTKIKETYIDRVYFKLIGDPTYRNSDLGIQGISWKADTEVDDLSELAIGIMPLPDNSWTQGKCGMKGLQYMALGIPTIMSPVGVNKDIIQDGENGFLASTEAEWVEKLTLLIENPDQRERLGKAGRQTVVEKYSVEVNKHLWLDAFQSVLK